MQVLSRWLLVLVSLLVLLLVRATPALAQSVPSPPSAKPSPADEATAKRNFESGLKLYGEGAFPEALIAFEQSYRLGGRPSALKNVAQCHRSLKHFVEAYEAYEQTLALHEAQISNADKTAVKQALDELGVLTGTLEVIVNEAGADIEIDGKALGRSPMAKPKRVKVETHAVRVTKAGFDPVERSVAIGSQEQKKLELTLAAETTVGHVLVREQSGREVHVFVDGADKGPAPWEGDLDAGEHAVEVKSDRFAAEPRKVRITKKERVDLAFEAAPLLGRLRVTTIPASATIAVDGREVGSGAWEGEVPPGAHRIEVSLGDPNRTASQVRQVVIARGQILVQEIPVVAALGAGHITEYTGLYGGIALVGGIGLSGNPDNRGGSGVNAQSSFMALAGLAARVGHAWGWWSAEAVGMFFLEHHDREYSTTLSNGTSGGGSPATYEYIFQDQSTAPNGFFGLGGRVTSRDDSVRLTLGVAPGLMIRSLQAKRDTNSGTPPNNNGGSDTRFATSNNATGCSGNCSNNDSTQKFSSAGYTSFGLMIDAGVLIGSSPGTKFYLGAVAIVDAAPTVVVGPDTVTPIADAQFKAPGRGILASENVALYIGPTLGLRFGH